MKAELIIFGGTALTMTGEDIPHAVIKIKAGKISELSSRVDFDPARDANGARCVDARRCLVLPGFVNGHTHAGMSLLRGVGDDLPLHEWLFNRIFPLERKWGNESFVYAGTQLAILEMIRSGTTTFNDMYYFEESAARAVNESGIRAICGQTIVEISGVENNGDEIFQKFDEYLEKIQAYPLVTAGITPHSIYGVKPETWRRILDYADSRDLVIHTHLAETQQEEDDCLKTFGKTPTEVFDDLGLWDRPRVVAAHATCVTEREIEILGEHHIGIAHNPESNLKLGTRICPVVELRNAGARMALGTDSTASNNNLDLIQEAATAAKLQTFRLGPSRLTAEEIVKILTCEGAAAVGLSDQIGSLEVGKAADIIAIDTHKPHLTPLYNPYSHLIYAASGSDVKHSIVNGQILMENYRVTTIDEEAILKEAANWGAKIAAEL